MNRINLIVFIFLFLTHYGHAQDINKRDSLTRKNSVYLEIAGDGVLFSLNYDRLLYYKNEHSIIGRAGFGFLYNIALVEGTYAFGTKHCLEHGISYGHDLTGHWFMHYRLGYRYRGNRGLLVRAAPLMQYNKFSGNPSPIGFWYGVSIGYSF